MSWARLSGCVAGPATALARSGVAPPPTRRWDVRKCRPADQDTRLGGGEVRGLQRGHKFNDVRHVRIQRRIERERDRLANRGREGSARFNLHHVGVRIINDWLKCGERNGGADRRDAIRTDLVNSIVGGILGGRRIEIIPLQRDDQRGRAAPGKAAWAWTPTTCGNTSTSSV